MKRGRTFAEDFASRTTQVALKTYFAEVAERSIKELLGESGTSAFLYHTGGPRILQDPKGLENALRDIFGPGAEIILEHILKNAETLSQT